MTNTAATKPILIVEPDAVLRLALTQLMSAAGFAPTAVADSMQALYELDQNDFAVIVSALDFGKGMPHGIALGRIARQCNPKTTIFLLGEDRAQLLAARDAGIGHVFKRPITADVFLSAAREQLAC